MNEGLAGMALDQNVALIEQSARRRTLSLASVVTIIAILMFAVISSLIVSKSLHNHFFDAEPVNYVLIVALLLNFGLIIFGWRRHAMLRHEVSIRAAAEERARQLAASDPLTGFLNRRSIAEEGAAMLVESRRRNLAMAILMMDLDHFKAINDMHGHSVGDALLRSVAREVSEIIPSSALSARLGGDEFAFAFLFDPNHPDVVERIAERLVSRMAQPISADGLRLHISCSLGIARSDFDCSGIDTLMRAADIAMYASKRSGRNTLAWFDRSMEREIQLRNELESGLRSALQNGQIIPFFEQQVDLSTGRIQGFEALARWQHPVRGIIAPDQFIPIAEDTGMIGDLSLTLMRQAMLAARDWDRTLTLSVNISPRQLRDAWLAQKIIKVLTETGFPANRLEIEITESSLFDNLALAQSIVGSLKNQGVRVALDDFGTGYSSLAHLRSLPFDRIKIDKSFVKSINENPDSAAIVYAILGLGESLNLPITAEGVETREVEARLSEMGCTKAQGWLYGQPLPACGVRRLLAERRLLNHASAQPQERERLIQAG